MAVPGFLCVCVLSCLYEQVPSPAKGQVHQGWAGKGSASCLGCVNRISPSCCNSPNSQAGRLALLVLFVPPAGLGSGFPGKSLTWRIRLGPWPVLKLQQPPLHRTQKVWEGQGCVWLLMLPVVRSGGNRDNSTLPPSVAWSFRKADSHWIKILNIDANKNFRTSLLMKQSWRLY